MAGIGFIPPGSGNSAAGVKVSDLTYPLVIAHRGAGNLFPENTLSAYEGALSLGCTAIEAGDIQASADGGLVCMHDSTVDRTTTNTGNVNAFPVAAFRRMVTDASAWFGGGWPDTTVPLFDDALIRVGGRAVVVPEVKDQLDSTATLMCKKIASLGLQKSVIVSSFQITNLAIAASYGIATMLVCSTIAAVPPVSTLTANGVGFVTIDHTATGSHATLAATLHAGGIKLIAYTVDHQVDYAAMIAAGLDGVYSNDPVYVSGNYAAYRRAKTSWHLSGTWSHGMSNVPGDGPYVTGNRGTIVGPLGANRWQPTPYLPVVAGEVCPVPSPAGTYTITTVLAFESIPSGNSNGACIFAAVASDAVGATANNVPSSYLIKARASGVINVWSLDASNTAIAKGAVTGTAPSIPVLSSGLTSGVAVTSLPVNALTVALKTGHQFYLPTGQVVTLTANAAISATALTVASITPTATVATGSSLIPRLTITIAVTPTTVTVSRADETTATPLAFTDSTQRGSYIMLQNAVDNGTGFTSFESVAVA